MVQDVTVVGAGPAGLMAADVISKAGYKVIIRERMAAPARKLLMAGRGGLNLSNAEPYAKFLMRYGSASPALEPALTAFSPQDLRNWCEELGIETFIGTSGRIFPQSLKSSPLLRAVLHRLASRGVELKLRDDWQGFDDTPTILALGGASWPHLGSNAAWVPYLRSCGIEVNDFKPANGRFLVAWSPYFADKFAGTPIKNVALTYGAERVRGEIMITRDGIEGGALYALSRHLRDEPGHELLLDLRPDLTGAEIAAKISQPKPKESLANHLRKSINLPPVAISLLRENQLSATAETIKAVPIKIIGPAGLERAISSAGGVSFQAVDEHFQLKAKPLCYAVGEMLDWEAPTGGYLLQACFSTAFYASQDLVRRLNER